MPEFGGSLRRTAVKARLVVRGVTALSPATMRAIATNSLKAARQDRKDRAVDRKPADAVAAGVFLSATPMMRDGKVIGVTALYERASVDVECMANDVVKISWGPDDAPTPWATSIDQDLPELGEIDITQTSNSVTLRTPSLRLVVATDGIKINDDAGRLRYHELAPLRRGPVRLHRRLLRPQEQIFGFGEQAGRLNHRGRTLRLWNRDPGGSWGESQDELYCSLPISLTRHSDGGVLVFHENSFDATVRIDADTDDNVGEVETRFTGGMVRTWIALGDDATLLRRLSGITGKAPLPPRWALGYHHSRWGFESSEEVDEVLLGFAQRGIPLSGIHLDIDYTDQFRIFTIDEQRFGGIDELSERAGTRGTRVVAIVDPALSRDDDFELYREARNQDLLVKNEDGSTTQGTVWAGWSVFPDFSKPATRTWWSSLYPRLLDRGVTGIWHDMNEPTSMTLNGDRTLARSVRHDSDGRGADHRDIHNVYGLLMNRAGRDGLLAHRPQKRPFIVSRSGWAGMQRDAWIWTGDVESTPKGLVQQIATFLGLSLSGVSLSGSDIGGFSGAPSTQLFVRWMELGVMSPFFRTHSVLGAPKREPWLWPAPYGDQVASLIALRYRLLPYLYSVIEAMTRDGSPYFRPLWWGDKNAIDGVANCDDALLVGPSLLFAVSTGGEHATRSVTLPRGSWWRWRAVPGTQGLGGDVAERFTGNETYEFAVPLGQPLLFVRAGSVVPLDDAWRAPSRPAGGLHVDHAPQRLAFHLFPDELGQAKGEHFDDDGDGDGPTRRDQISLDDDVVTWNSEGERLRPASLEIVIHGRVLRGAIADGVPVAPGALSTDGSSTTIRVDAFKRLKLS